LLAAAVAATTSHNRTGKADTRPTLHKPKHPTIHGRKSPSRATVAIQTESVTHYPGGIIGTGGGGPPIFLGCSSCGQTCGTHSYCLRNGSCVFNDVFPNFPNCGPPGTDCESCYIHAIQNVDICKAGYWENYYDEHGCYCPRCYACTKDSDCTGGETCTGKPKVAGGPSSCAPKSCGLFDPCPFGTYTCTQEAQGVCVQCPQPICPDTCNGHWQAATQFDGCPVCPTCVRRYVPPLSFPSAATVVAAPG